VNPADLMFRRRFSVNFYKTLRFRLCEMSMAKDFTRTNRGNPHPLLRADGEREENVGGGVYRHSGGGTVRLLGMFFPYATYEMTVRELCGEAGFAFFCQEEIKIALFRDGENCGLRFTSGGKRAEVPLDGIPEGPVRFVVSLRRSAVDVYLGGEEGGLRYAAGFDAPEMESSAREDVMKKSSSAVMLRGAAVISGVGGYMDCGVSQADIRPVRTEDGEVLVESGRIWFTVSVRMQAECYQGIFSWIPGTEEFEMTGALFYDAGDGVWGNEVAASVLYDRNAKRWLVWVCAFSRGHILGWASSPGDIRFGLNVLDITLVEKAGEGTPIEAFPGRKGDEDPDFRYLAGRNVWVMAVCRIAEGGYAYLFYESKDPFRGYRFVGRTRGGSLTGGSFVDLGGELYFVCGSEREEGKVDYRVYRYGDFERHGSLKCDHDDGGWRGWGTVFPVTLGTRRRIFWLTFDRDGASNYTWSYGNLYCFEADV